MSWSFIGETRHFRPCFNLRLSLQSLLFQMIKTLTGLLTNWCGRRTLWLIVRLMAVSIIQVWSWRTSTRWPAFNREGGKAVLLLSRGSWSHRSYWFWLCFRFLPAQLDQSPSCCNSCSFHPPHLSARQMPRVCAGVEWRQSSPSRCNLFMRESQRHCGKWPAAERQIWTVSQLNIVCTQVCRVWLAAQKVFASQKTQF